MLASQEAHELIFVACTCSHKHGTALKGERFQAPYGHDCPKSGELTADLLTNAYARSISPLTSHLSAT